MLRLSELKLPLDHSAADLEVAITRRLRLSPGELRGHHLVKRSVDARRRGAIALVYCLDLELEDGARRRLLRRYAGDPHLRATPDSRYRPVARAEGTSSELRPVVVSFSSIAMILNLLFWGGFAHPVYLIMSHAMQCPINRRQCAGGAGRGPCTPGSGSRPCGCL